jgi:hypothetical protein
VSPSRSGGRRLEFERALEVEACRAGDLHAIPTDCALHVSTAGTELFRTQRVLTQPPRPIWSQCAVYRAGCGVLIDADRRCKQSAHVIHVALAGRGNNRSADPDIQFGKSGKMMNAGRLNADAPLIKGYPCVRPQLRPDQHPAS